MTTFENATVVSYAATLAQRSAAGKALRAKAPRTSHEEWATAADFDRLCPPRDTERLSHRFPSAIIKTDARQSPETGFTREYHLLSRQHPGVLSHMQYKAYGQSFPPAGGKL